MCVLWALPGSELALEGSWVVGLQGVGAAGSPASPTGATPEVQWGAATLWEPESNFFSLETVFIFLEQKGPRRKGPLSLDSEKQKQVPSSHPIEGFSIWRHSPVPLHHTQPQTAPSLQTQTMLPVHPAELSVRGLRSQKSWNQIGAHCSLKWIRKNVISYSGVLLSPKG